MNPLLDATEVARILHREPASVTALARAGKLRGARDGKRWLFRPEDVEAYVEGLANRPTAVTRPRQRRRRMGTS